MTSAHPSLWSPPPADSNISNLMHSYSPSAENVISRLHLKGTNTNITINQSWRRGRTVAEPIRESNNYKLLYYSPKWTEWVEVPAAEVPAAPVASASPMGRGSVQEATGRKRKLSAGSTSTTSAAGPNPKRSRARAQSCPMRTCGLRVSKLRNHTMTHLPECFRFPLDVQRYREKLLPLRSAGLRFLARVILGEEGSHTVDDLVHFVNANWLADCSMQVPPHIAEEMLLNSGKICVKGRTSLKVCNFIPRGKEGTQ